MLDLFHISFNGTTEYISNTIESTKAKSIYLTEVARIIRSSAKASNLEVLKQVLFDEKEITETIYTNTWNPLSYRKYAINPYIQAIEIIESLQKRFGKNE